MADKFSWIELRRALSARAGISEQEANQFLGALIAQVIEGLKQDKQVKINGLGTFRLQAVAPRRSVNVNTGEEMTIEGYNKIVLTPEAGVKELVEKGERLKVKGERLEVKGEKKEEIDPLQKLGEQADEIIGILAEIDGIGKEEGKEEEGNEEPIAEPIEEPIEEPVVEPKPEPVVEPELVVEPEPEPVVEPEPEPVVEPEKPQEEKPKKRYPFLRDTLICVVLLLLLLLIGYFFLQSKISQWIESIGKDRPVAEQVVETKAQEDFVSEVKEPLKPQPQTYGKLIKTERITDGSRLAWISKKYYGDRVYWPYLYDANKDRLANPSKIIIGTPIRVPKLTPEQLDTTNEQTRVNLQYLLEEAEKAIREQ